MARRHAQHLPERLVELLRVIYPNLHAHLCDRQIRVFQQVTSVVDAPLLDVLNNGFPQIPSKQSGQLVVGNSGIPGKAGNTQRLL